MASCTDVKACGLTRMTLVMSVSRLNFRSPPADTTGILPNQTYVNGTGPDATLTTGANEGPLSYLPGMRTPACTCDGEVHPGPNNNVGRAAPEIDLIEAQIVVAEGHGEVSQSFQIAPYDDYYQFDNSSGTYEQYDTSITYFNTYLGGFYQQAVSSLTAVDNDIYYDQAGPNTGVFKMFGVEIMSNSADRSKGYVTWYSQGKKSWTMYGTAVGPNERTEVSQRLVSEEPMALVRPAMAGGFRLTGVDFQLGSFKQLPDCRFCAYDVSQLLHD